MKIPLLASLLALAPVLAAAQPGTPIKIGGSFDLSGAAASIGLMSQRGTEYAVEVLNKRGGVLGRQLSLELQDNGTNAQRAVNQSTQIARDGAVMLLAPQSTGNTLAVSSAVSARQKLPMCVAASAGDDVTMKQFQPYVFSVGPSQYMMFRGVAVRAAKGGFKRIGMIAVDTAGGHIGNERFKLFNKELNLASQVVVEEYVKLGSQDFTAALNKVLAAKPDFVFANLFGTDIITITKQGKAIDFFKQIKNEFAVLYDSNTLKALGGDAVVGTVGYTRAPFNYVMSTAEGRDFVQQFKARYGEYPSDEATMSYDCVTTWAAAVEKAKSTNADDVMRALEAGEFNSARGKFRFGKFDHMADMPVYLGRVAPSQQFGQPVLNIEEVVPGKLARPTEAVVTQSRQGG